MRINQAALLALGICLMFLGRSAMAQERAKCEPSIGNSGDKFIAECDEVIRLDPKNAKAYHNRGWAWAIQSKFDRAILDYNESIRLDPKNAKLYYDRALAWEFMSNLAQIKGLKSDMESSLDRALADYNEAIRLNSHNSAAYSKRGDIYEKRGDLVSALADFRSNVRLNPNDRYGQEDVRRIEAKIDAQKKR